jgi:hypothetical protein
VTKRIRNTGPTEKLIRDTSVTQPRIDPAEVAAALGGEPTGVTLEGALSPLSLFLVRQELFRRLQSSGGRPALSGTTRRAKIPLSDAEWSELEELAAAIAAPGCAPTAGQVASVLLTLSLQRVVEQLGKPAGRSRSPLARELAALAAAEAKRTRSP